MKYILPQNTDEKITEIKIYELPFVYNGMSYGENAEPADVLNAGFKRYINSVLIPENIKVASSYTYKELNENEATLIPEYRQLNEVEQNMAYSKTLSVDEWKSEFIKCFNGFANKAYNEYLANYPELEQSTFSQKANEAFKVVGDENTPLNETPFLANLASNNVEARNALARAVNEKVVYITALESFCVLKRDEIKAASDMDELMAIIIDMSDFNV